MRLSGANQGSLATGGHSDGSPDVVWFRPERQEHVPPLTPKTGDRPEPRSTMVVMALTFACTTMAILDLFLLASGS